MKSAPASASPATLPPALRVLLGLAAAVIVLAGISLARDLVGPLALGAVIVIICHPLRHPLERRGWPRWAATTAVVVLGYLILAVLAALLFYAGLQFAQLVGDYADQLQAAASDTLAWLHGIGLDEQAAEATASILQPENVLAFAASLGGTVVTVLVALFFVLAYVIFMAADAARYARAETSFGAPARPALARFRSFSRGVRRFYVVNAVFGAVVAIIDGLALWTLGVPAPAVWAILAFVTNFIPNIGFVLGLI
ncbi:MAG: AI-2E family transporter, partial [Gemmatimonadota bacterium]|nr:AI-2E family transporter [Gemmatimonadota bacterium]